MTNITKDEKKEIIARVGRCNLYKFATELCDFGHNPNPDGPRITSDQQGLLSWLEKPQSWLRMILTPRDTLKSTCLQAYVLWRLIDNPDLRILLYGEVHEQAQKRLQVIKQVITYSEAFRYVYGHIQGTPWNEEMLTISTRKNRSLREASIETAGLDVVVNARHFDLIIPDDLQSEKNTKTRDQIDEIKHKVELLMPLLTKGGEILFAGVFWSDNDVYVEYSQHPDISIYKQSIYKPDGSLQYPHQLPLNEIEKRRHFMRSDLFNCHYLLDPVPKASQKFKREYFQEIDVIPQTRNFLLIDQAGDPTAESASKRDSDNYGIVSVGITTLREIIILDITADKFSPTEAIEQAITHIIKYKPFIIGIERAGVGNMSFYLREELRRRGMSAIVIDLMPKGRSKYQRIMELEPLARNRKIYMARNAAQKEDFYVEAERFPKAKYDDIIDSLAYIIDLLEDYAPQPYIESDETEENLNLSLSNLNPVSQAYWYNYHKNKTKDENWIHEYV